MKHILRIAAWTATATQLLLADPLEKGFQKPPDSTKPWCYWYWISDNISREGITRDLEAMKRVGIGEAFIGNIYLEDIKIGGVKALTEEWWGMVEHAIREGGRVGVNVGLFNCPGWSQSGGPWIKPSQAMQYVAHTERRLTGPVRFNSKIPAPTPEFQDLSVLAFPAPQNDADLISSKAPQVICTAPCDPALARRVVDGDRKTTFVVPETARQSKKPFTIELQVDAPFTARSLVFVPAQANFAAQCELSVADGDSPFRAVRKFRVDRSNNSVGVGFVPYAPVAISFDPVSGTKFRLALTGMRGEAEIAELELAGAARVERYMEKQLAKMHPTPLPMWDAYLWPATTATDAAALAVPDKKVLDLSDKLQPDGTLTWDVPPGEWVVLRMGMTPTGTKNSPASPEGQGLEVDKMNAGAAQAHFDAFIGKLLARMPANERKAFRRVIADSYEMGSQNWTDGLREIFKQRYGYDPQPWLPVLTGRIVNSSEQSDRFLWDLRRMVADQVSYGYVGGLRRACNNEGLRLWLENYGHWGFPGEFLQYGGQSDDVSGEFWATGELGSIELRAAASAAHTYGKPIVSAEAFTSVLKFESTPWSLKKRGDWALTEGINHWVLHVYIHQPWEDRLPGVNAWFSTEFNRHNTWFEESREWIDYYRRCDFLLQQGKHVADLAYFIGEDTPKMTGIRKPDLPQGYNFDYINAEVIEQRLNVKNGRFVLPDGMSYRLLVLPELETMRPELLQKIRDLVAAGGAILGNPPSRSPSLQNYPACDDRVKELAAQVWPEPAKRSNPGSMTESRLRKGRVFRSDQLQPVLDALEIPPDVSEINPKEILWTHRSSRDAEIYFLSNQSDRLVTICPLFRVVNKSPEFWDPVTREIRRAAVFQSVAAGTRVALDLEPRESIFVVFRERLRSSPVIAEVLHGNEVLLSTFLRQKPIEPGKAKPSGSFTIAAWVKPGGEIGLPKEAAEGVQLQQVRNELVVPFHGDTLFPDGGHAGAGLSIGVNGLVVYEHSGNYFAPVLSLPSELKDWTHVAVVYRDNRPSLYLNGRLARQGLQSRFQSHSGLLATPGGNPGFKGEFSSLQDFPEPLSDSEIAELAKSKPAAGGDRHLPRIVLSGAGAGVQAEVFSAEPFTLTWSNGRQSRVRARDYLLPIAITGPWHLRIMQDRGAPRELSLDRLISLSEHKDPAVKFFSGTVAYHQTFEVAPDHLEKNRRLWVDLGRVESVAEVILNGQNLGVFWKPPYIVNITEAARPGPNKMEVRVTGTWRNRLVGDVKYPEGFGETGSTFKPFLTADINVNATEALQPFGLIGPVRLQSSEKILVKP